MEKKINILFVCQGNICRSPMAMFILRYRLEQMGLSDKYNVTSAALEHSTKGEDMYIEAKKLLDENHIPYSLHSAHPLSPREYLVQDYVLYMENYQKIEIKRMMSNNHPEKLHRLYDYTCVKKDIADPYYSGDFRTAFEEISEAIDWFIKTEISKN